MTSSIERFSDRTEPDILETAERTLPGHRMHVTMSDGTDYEVRISNRDRVAWDKTAPRHKWGQASDVPFLCSTFLAWSASYREGLTTLNFDKFQNECDELVDVQADEDDEARPTR